MAHYDASCTESVRQRLAMTRDERGLSTVEYVIILVLIASAAVVSWQALSGTVKVKISESDTNIRAMEGEGANGQANAHGPTAGKEPTSHTNNSAPVGQATRRTAGKVDD